LQEVRVAVAPVLRGFQAEVDAAARRTKAADSALLAIYKKLVHMPGNIDIYTFSKLEHLVSFERFSNCILYFLKFNLSKFKRVYGGSLEKWIIDKVYVSLYGPKTGIWLIVWLD
jgi:hypothetical protein